MFKRTKIEQTIIFPNLIRKILTSWMIAVLIEYLLLPKEWRSLVAMDGLAQMSFTRVIILTVAGVFLLCILSGLISDAKWERWGMFGSFILLALLSIYASFSKMFLAVCVLIAVAFAIYGKFGWDSSPQSPMKCQKEHKIYLWITAFFSVLFFLFVSIWTVSRIYSFDTPSFDFGIFSQMFYNMKETGLPMTTIERDGLLSHFAVHVSPIFYLFLPFYWLIPNPAVLQVLQAAVITSAIIPLWLLGKRNGLSDVQRMLLCMALLLYPAFSGAASFDIHENCFLMPLILWLFYGIDSRNVKVIVLSAVLTLLVKEDAAVYVAVIALWLMVKSFLQSRKVNDVNFITGILLLLAALAWFFMVTKYLTEYGDGVMNYRYGNFIYDDSNSLVTVIKAVIMNPMKVIYECVDTEKRKFVLQTMLPLIGIPFLTRRYERYILLIPYILLNLMSDYPFQHDVFFQYTFGPTAFLLYLTVVNIADFRNQQHKRIAFTSTVIIAAICFTSIIVPKAIYYPQKSIQNYEYYQGIREVLSQIPKDASVTATRFYTTFLSQREILYDVQLSSTEHMLETEYVVLDIATGNLNNEYEKYMTDGKENGFENLILLLEQNGYTQYLKLDEVLVIYKKI